MAHAKTDWDSLAVEPADWYASAEGKRVVESILNHQRLCGGWDKNYDVTPPADPVQLASTSDGPGTFDNDATIGEMRVLAKAFEVTGDKRAHEAFLRGLAFIYESQYENGGWPQIYPLSGGYNDAISYNDDAMYRVLELLRDIARGDEPFGFLDDAQRERAQAAFDLGIGAVLDTQVVVDGRPTAWCAQHDAETLAPTKARVYEHPSLSGAESVKLVLLLMSIDNPSPRVVDAVQGAVAWFDAVRIPGVSYERVTLPDGSKDRLLVPSDDPDDVWWARFYEIGTNRPIFSGRDGVIRYDLSDVELERRLGYSWYSKRAETLLAKDYPAWQQQWAPGQNVLADPVAYPHR